MVAVREVVQVAARTAVHALENLNGYRQQQQKLAGIALVQVD